MKKIVGVLLVTCLCFAASSAFGEVIGPLSQKDGLLLGVGYATSNRVEQDHEKYFKSDQLYGSVEYTSKGWQPYLRLGYTDLEINNFRDSERAFGTLGLKKALYQKNKWTAGAFGQISLFQNLKDQKMGMMVMVKDLKEAKMGALGQYTIGRVEVYAGPFYNWLDGKVVSTSCSLNVKADDDVGGLAGVVVDLGKNFGLNVEVQQTSKTSIATALTYRF